MAETNGSASSSDSEILPEYVREITGTISVPLVSRTGTAVGTLTLDPTIFGGKISKLLLHEAVLMYLANQRAGTHSTLRRGQVAGSTKKLFRQKGTGNARAGTKRTNKRRGGGTAKGPKPRDYEYHLPKKAVRIATRMALLSKFADGEVIVIDDLAFAAPKTKEFVGVLKAIKIGTKKIKKVENGAEIEKEIDLSLLDTTLLLGTEKYDVNAYKSGRNIEGVKILPTAEFTAYTLLKHKRLVLTKAAFENLVNPKPAEPTPTAPEAPRIRRGRAGRIQKRKAAQAAK
jgi:large subunit ribosomal protein L4